MRYRIEGLVAILAAAAPGCAPSTDLAGEGAGASGPAGGGTSVSAGALLDPSPGSVEVPRNLAAVMVRFPPGATVSDGALELSGGAGRVAAGTLEPMDCPAGAPGTCVRLPMVDLLSPAAAYQVVSGDGITDQAGRAIAGGMVGQFTTAAEADLTPPVLAGLSIVPSGPCALVSFTCDEPAAATLVLTGAGLEERVPAGAGTTAFSVAASLAPFGAGADVQVVVRVADRAGNVAESAAVALAVPSTLVPLAITEVRANPAGAEPQQEFVELRNLGAAPLDLAGLSLEDAKGGDALAGTLEAGAYALVVAATFDPTDPTDTLPKAGTALIRVEGRLGADGLSNGGEVVRLRAADGTIVSSYGTPIDVSATKWAGKSVHRIPEEACDQPASWTVTPLPSTPGWGAP